MNAATGPIPVAEHETEEGLHALERLESQILTMVDRLREEQRARQAVERQLNVLRKELADKDALVEAVRNGRAKLEASQNAVRERIAALIERIETLEQEQPFA